MTSLLVLLLAILRAEGASPANAACPKGEASKVVRALQDLPASKLDAALPDERVEVWFEGVLGAGVAACWEENDCGEQTGDPAIDGERDLPVCAEMWARLPSGATAGVLVGMGAASGLRLENPVVRSIYFQAAETEVLEDLSALVERIRREEVSARSLDPRGERDNPTRSGGARGRT